MKYFTIEKDGKEIARCEGYDTSINGMNAIIHDNVPCSIIFYDDGKVYNRMRCDGKNLDNEEYEQ